MTDINPGPAAPTSDLSIRLAELMIVGPETYAPSWIPAVRLAGIGVLVIIILMVLRSRYA